MNPLTLILRAPAPAVLLAGALAAAWLPAHAQTTPAEFEQCYQAYGQVESVQQGNRKVTTYKSQAEVAQECNAKVVARARQEKDAAKVTALANVVGHSSNWQSALAVYAAGIRGETRKALCADKDAHNATELALSSPAGHPHSGNALAYLQACWPDSQPLAQNLLKAGADSYHKEHLCKFLGGKKALPAQSKSQCPA